VSIWAGGRARGEKEKTGRPAGKWVGEGGKRKKCLGKSLKPIEKKSISALKRGERVEGEKKGRCPREGELYLESSQKGLGGRNR